MKENLNRLAIPFPLLYIFSTLLGLMLFTACNTPVKQPASIAPATLAEHIEATANHTATITVSEAPTQAVPPTPVLAPTEETTATLAPQVMDTARLAEFEGYVQEAMAKARIPGMAVALVQDGEVIYAKGFGLRELGKQDPVTPETLMMIGSTTKPLTTLMMATVVDDGLMSWDTLAKDILPSFSVGSPELTQKLTMRNTVCACSGWQGDGSEIFFSDDVTAEEIVRSMREIPPVGEFEKSYFYSNQMIAAGGYLAGLAAGGPPGDLLAGYESAMQARVFDPLGMNDTTLSIEKVQSSKNYALPHGRMLDGEYQPLPLSAEKFVHPIAPAGAVWSNVQDMAKILILEMSQGLVPGGQRIVTQENMTRTWEPQVAMEEGDSAYALGWFIKPYLEKTLIHHSGNSLGFSADLAFIPEANLGIVVLTNAEGAGNFTNAVFFRFFELAFGQEPAYDTAFKFGLAKTTNALSSFANAVLPEVDPQVIEPYLGEFQNDRYGKMRLAVENSRLMFHTDGLSSALGQYSGQAGPTLVLTDPPFVSVGFWSLLLNRDEDGKPIITLYENGGPEPVIYKKIPTP